MRTRSWCLGGARPQPCSRLPASSTPGMSPEQPHLCRGVHTLRWPRVPGGGEPRTQPRDGTEKDPGQRFGGTEHGSDAGTVGVRPLEWTSTCALTGMPSDPGVVTSASGGRPSTEAFTCLPRVAATLALHVRWPEPSVGSCDQPGAHNLPSLPRKHSREAVVLESSCQSGFYLFLHILFCC